MSFGSRSLPSPTEEESRRIAAIKLSGCIACRMRGFNGVPCEYHHLKRGGMRVGHRFGFGLCQYHHRAIIPTLANRALYAGQRGPSLADGANIFHEEFGSDQQLLDTQDKTIGWPPAQIKRCRRGKSTATPSKVIARTYA